MAGVISFPAPALSQGADEDWLIEFGEVMFPGMYHPCDG